MRIDIEKGVKSGAPQKAIEQRKRALRTAIFVACSFLFTLSANAQCAMCRAAIETEGNTAKAEAVNDGIVYLMVIPYLLLGVIGFVIYKMRQKKAI